MLNAQNASVAQTIVGTDDFNCMKIMKTHNVLDMLATGTFAHAQKSSTCAFDALVKLLSILLRNTLQSVTKQLNTKYVIDWVCANVHSVNV